MTIRILEGHILDVLSREQAGSVHCAVTSPPYLWLRAYGTEPQVWGPADCAHEWGAPEEMAGPGKRGDTKVRWQHTGVGQSGHERWSSAFCSRCGAWRGELGQEPHPELYVQHLVAVMEAVKRVLRDDGTLWVNLAGCYFNDPGGQNGGSRNGTGASTLMHDGRPDPRPGTKLLGLHAISAKAIEANAQLGRKQRGRHPWLKALDWVDVPGLFAHAMQAAGWLWRSDVVWVKPSALPESVSGTRWERCRARLKGQTTAEGTKYGEGFGYRAGNFRDETPENAASRAEWADCPGCPRCATTQGYVLRRGNGRPTKSTERVLLFIKRSGAYFDSEAVREPASPSSDFRPRPEGYEAPYGQEIRGTANLGNGSRGDASGRNLRDWWVLSPEPLADEHYAAYPTTLPTRCIKAGTSERGCCPGCGAPWARVVERTVHFEGGSGRAGNTPDGKWAGTEQAVSGEYDIRKGPVVDSTTLGWRPTCRCPGAADMPPVPCRVLDPFAGSGTTLIAADRLGRDAIGVELKPAYARLAERRLHRDAPLLTWGQVTLEQTTTRSVPEGVPLPLEAPEDAVAGG